MSDCGSSKTTGLMAAVLAGSQGVTAAWGEGVATGAGQQVGGGGGKVHLFTWKRYKCCGIIHRTALHLCLLVILNVKVVNMATNYSYKLS